MPNEQLREVGHFPKATVLAGHVEPAPRRVRGLIGERMVFDTEAALYEWEWPYYPQYAIPLDDVDPSCLVDEGTSRHDHFGAAALHSLVVGDVVRPGAARVRPPGDGPLAATVRFDWAGLDAWYEEDERIVVHPRSPYVRVDAIRCDRPVRVELAGTVLAESDTCVRVFETGLPTRHYLPALSVRPGLLEASDTVTECPYKGTTSAYWSVRLGDRRWQDLAWRYDFPTRQLLAVAGMVAFYDEEVDTYLGGRMVERPRSHFGS